MYVFILFILGFIAGCIIMILILDIWKRFDCGHGNFQIADGPDPELPDLKTVKIELKQYEDLTKVNTIILKKSSRE